MTMGGKSTMKSSGDAFLVGIALLVAAVIGAFFIYSMRTMAMHVNKALQSGPQGNGPGIEVNIEGAKQVLEGRTF